MKLTVKICKFQLFFFYFHELIFSYFLLFSFIFIHRNKKDEIENAEGMWGVWEISSIGSHYELQKGGVFRAIVCCNSDYVL